MPPKAKKRTAEEEEKFRLEEEERLRIQREEEAIRLKAEKVILTGNCLSVIQLYHRLITDI